MMNVGILGGGQLAQMLALSGHPLGLKISVLAASPTDPAAQVVGNTHIAALADEVELRRFLAPLDFVTFESEFIDTALVASALPKTCKPFPALPVMRTIQDRLTQKQLLE